MTNLHITWCKSDKMSEWHLSQMKHLHTIAVDMSTSAVLAVTCVMVDAMWMSEKQRHINVMCDCNCSMIDSLSCVGFLLLSLNFGWPALCPGLFLLPAGQSWFLGGSESMKLGSDCGGERDRKSVV